MPYKFKQGGIVTETGARELPFPLSKAVMVDLLTKLINESANFSHHDFMAWAIKQHDYILVNGHMEARSAGVDESLLEVLAEMDTEWDLHLLDTYSYNELQTLDLSTVGIPKSWFIRWLKNLP
ncbi:MAG: hypothetical protein JWQ27_380 [Ferruginibacter sp.]|nr:hypothetical protein [Ferruginibacter sp.]